MKATHRRRLLFFSLAFAIVAGLWLGAREWYWSSLRPVVEGTLYRSGQPDARDIRTAASRYGIRSIVNLRGERTKIRWYKRDSFKEARAAASALGLQQEHLRFQTFGAPPQLEVRRLVEVFGRARDPMLIHCESGIDRSGWASAVFLALRGGTLERALAEMSIWNGHICRSDRCSLHRFFDEYRQWLADSHHQHTGPLFREWSTKTYCPQPYDAEIQVEPEAALQVMPASQLHWSVRVRNRSRENWKTKGPNPIRLGVRILGPYEKPIGDPLDLFRIPNGPARDLDRDFEDRRELPPGASVLIEKTHIAPREPGIYYLHFDMVEESRHWFSDLGSPGVVRSIRVMESSPTVFLTGFRPSIS